MDMNLKSLLLAGIGSVAYTYEKASEVVDTLVKKGEITLNQGKELNEELKRVINEKKVDANTNSADVETIKNIIAQLNLPTKQDIEDIKTRLDNLENK
jgi:polyhydroxyalkanoate synthesis regulator phasin